VITAPCWCGSVTIFCLCVCLSPERNSHPSYVVILISIANSPARTTGQKLNCCAVALRLYRKKAKQCFVYLWHSLLLLLLLWLYCTIVSERNICSSSSTCVMVKVNVRWGGG
jgi:hypothetical protein